MQRTSKNYQVNLILLIFLFNLFNMGCGSKKQGYEENIVQNQRDELGNNMQEWIDGLSDEELAVYIKQINDAKENLNRDKHKWNSLKNVEDDEYPYHGPFSLSINSPYYPLSNPIDVGNANTIINRNGTVSTNQLSPLEHEYVNTEIWKIIDAIDKLKAHSSGKYTEHKKYGIKSFEALYDKTVGMIALNDILINQNDACYNKLLTDHYKNDSIKMRDSLFYNRETLVYQIIYNGKDVPNNLVDNNNQPIHVWFDLGRLCPPKCPSGGGSGKIGSKYPECQ